jgi:hypothetical protein
LKHSGGWRIVAGGCFVNAALTGLLMGLTPWRPLDQRDSGAVPRRATISWRRPVAVRVGGDHRRGRSR